MTLVAGIDSSTQSCKVVVLDAESGRLVRSGRAAHPSGTEVDPEAWWVAVREALAEAGGLGGGPWLDGRVRSVFAAAGYLASAIDDGVDRYANVAETMLTAMQALCDDVRAGRQTKGEPR